MLPPPSTLLAVVPRLEAQPVANLLERLVDPLAQARASQTWPPTQELDKWWNKVENFRSRYENDRDKLLADAPFFSATTYGQRIFTTLGVAREVCNLSAEMLFSAPPQITFEDNEELLEKILDANGLNARLVAMAGAIAAEGRGGLRIIDDPQVADAKLITHVHEDQLIWDERHGAFVVGGVVIIDVTPPAPWTGARTTVYRLLEEHTTGMVRRKLYRGNSTQLGQSVALNTLAAFQTLPEEESTGLDVPTLIRWDNVPGGYSDLAGAESMLDRINTEVSLGSEKSEKSRPVSFADSRLFDEAGNVDTSGVVPIRQGKLQQLEQDMSRLYGTIQPESLAPETIAWIDFLIDATLLSMAYSKASYGRDQGGSADSGKALRLRQARTLLRKAGKDLLAVEAITNALAVAMAWQDGKGAPREVANYRADIKLGDGLPRDPLEDAQEAQIWGDAISLEEKIRIRRPEWSDEQVEEEIARIQEQSPAPAPSVPNIP